MEYDIPFKPEKSALHAQVCTGRPRYLVGSYLSGRRWVSDGIWRPAPSHLAHIGFSNICSMSRPRPSSIEAPVRTLLQITSDQISHAPGTHLSVYVSRDAYISTHQPKYAMLNRLCSSSEPVQHLSISLINLGA